jgi:ketosteroid isomerase-like protein
MKKSVLMSFLILTGHLAFAQTDPMKEAKMIKSLREASNEAIAKHDIEGLSKIWMEDLVLVRGNSTHQVGKDTIVGGWKKLFRDNPKVAYIRTPSQIIISSNDTLAWETGSWKAVQSYSHGGNYSAMWKKSHNSWKILAELFVSLF